jgi:acyl-ACP thioesterase
MNPRHTPEFGVHLHHIGSNGLARPSLLFDCFQDAASEQSARLGFSIRELMERGLTWVVSRYRVNVFRYPRWQERIRVTTWRSTQQGRTAPREFAVEDADNRTIALARGIFILLDRSTNRPVSPTDHIPGYPTTGETVFEEAFQAPPGISFPDRSTRIHVRRDDLDLNRHVNNTRYLTFALESVPGPVMGSHMPDLIDISFFKSAGYGDTVRSLIQQHLDHGDQPRFIHQLVGETEPVEYCRLSTRWKRVS